jgi:hypothetical protein
MSWPVAGRQLNGAWCGLSGIALVMLAKFGDHIAFNRQAEIDVRQ